MGSKALKKILYVDDEEISLMLIQIAFKNKYNIVVARSGPEGLRMIKENNDIQLIISDMKMPVMDGLEFITLAKKVNENIPCVLLSGFDRDDVIEDAISSSLIVDYFTKPLDKKKLENFILNM